MECHNRVEGPVSDEEHMTFLNMWLDRFLFCGASYAPSRTYSAIAEQLSQGRRLSLGMMFFGSVYQMMHAISDQIFLHQGIVGAIGGPIWFI